MEQKQKLGQEPAFATQHVVADANDPAFKLGKSVISKRFYAACAAMQGICADPNVKLDENGCVAVAKMAYGVADELLKQEKE